MYYTVDFRAIRHSLAADPARQPDLPRRGSYSGSWASLGYPALPCTTVLPWATLPYPTLHYPAWLPCPGVPCPGVPGLYVHRHGSAHPALPGRHPEVRPGSTSLRAK